MANKKDFSYNPVGLSRERTKFALPFNHKTSFKLGELIPLACIDILPGDTFSSKVASVIRMSSPIAPIMDHFVCFLNTLLLFFLPVLAGSNDCIQNLIALLSLLPGFHVLSY